MAADARSSEQHATREPAIGNDGMTPKFDDEIPFAALAVDVRASLAD